MKRRILLTLVLALLLVPVGSELGVGSIIATASGGDGSTGSTATDNNTVPDDTTSGDEIIDDDVIFGDVTIVGGSCSTATGNNSVSSSSEEDTDDVVVTTSGEAVVSETPTQVTGGVTSAAITTETSTINAAVGGVNTGEYVNVSVSNSQCGPEARKMVNAAANSVGAEIAAVLDIFVDVVNQNGVPSKNVTELSAPIEFKVSAPEDIDGNVYDFAVIRIHDGQATILPDVDNDPTTVTFRTDKFSVYALIYDEKGAFDDLKAKDGVLKTGDTTIPVWPFLAVSVVAASAALTLRKKEEV